MARLPGATPGGLHISPETSDASRSPRTLARHDLAVPRHRLRVRASTSTRPSRAPAHRHDTSLDVPALRSSPEPVGAYAGSIRQDAPEAAGLADRGHLIRNPHDAVKAFADVHSAAAGRPSSVLGRIYVHRQRHRCHRWCLPLRADQPRRHRPVRHRGTSTIPIRTPARLCAGRATIRCILR
jgi:hypothetical protein